MLNSFQAYYYEEAGGNWSRASLTLPGPFAPTLKTFLFTTYAPYRWKFRQEWGSMDFPFTWNNWNPVRFLQHRYDLPFIATMLTPDDPPYEPDEQISGTTNTNEVKVRGFYATNTLNAGVVKLGAADVPFEMHVEVDGAGGTVQQTRARWARSDTNIWFPAVVPETELTQEMIDNLSVTTNLGEMGVVGIWTTAS